MAYHYAHSFSGLNKFETCPRQYEWRYILKHREPETDAKSWGKRVHSAFEDKVRDDKPLPVGMQSYEWALTPIQAAKNVGACVLLEHKIAMDQAGVPVVFESEKAYVRAIVDVAILGKHSAILGDYKTGGRFRPSTQLQFSTWIAFHTWPAIEIVDTKYLYLKLKHTEPETLHRSKIHQLAGNILPRLHKLERARASGVFEPKPGGLCRQYCQVVTCEFHGR